MMKKMIKVLLIAAIIGLSTGISDAKKAADNNEKGAEKDNSVQIIKPEKSKKVNKKQEAKNQKLRNKTKANSSKEAEGMYETKFPVIESDINLIDIPNLPDGISLIDCIKLAITHHPTIMSAISNAEIYKSKIGQAWSNYFPTISAGVSYSRNDMLMTMGGAMAKMIPQRYNMFYVPNLSADMLLFDFGKTKAYADNAKRYYESARFL